MIGFLSTKDVTVVAGFSDFPQTCLVSPHFLSLDILCLLHIFDFITLLNFKIVYIRNYRHCNNNYINLLRVYLQGYKNPF